jgi:hypothetical protein
MEMSKEILIFAFRYAIERASYSTVSVMNNIINNLDKLSDNDLSLFIREINEFQNFVDYIEKDAWMDFSYQLQKELVGREKNARI